MKQPLCGPDERTTMANFGTVGVDWQERVNWDRLRKYRLERARERMKAHNLGALLLMYDENVRYVTSTLTPGWNRLKPGLRYALLCGDGPPVLFEQGDIGFQIQRHAPWIPEENIRWSYAWIKGAAGPASKQQVKKFTDAVVKEMRRYDVAERLIGDVVAAHLLHDGIGELFHLLLGRGAGRALDPGVRPADVLLGNPGGVTLDLEADVPLLEQHRRAIAAEERIAEPGLETVPARRQRAGHVADVLVVHQEEGAEVVRLHALTRSLEPVLPEAVPVDT